MSDTITHNVNRLLGKYPEMAHDNNLFVLTYWKECDNVKSLDDITQATSPESINRVKRRLLKGN